MIPRNITQIDSCTGEELSGCMVWIPDRPKLKEGWMMTFQKSLEEIAKDPDLTGEHLRIFMYLCARLDFENWIQQSQKEIAEALGMQKQNVSRAIKLLVQKYIILVERKGTSATKCYRLNPYYGWRGKVRNLTEYHREKMETTLKAVEKLDTPTPIT